MKNIPRNSSTGLILLAMLFSILGPGSRPVQADSLTNPVLIATSGSESPVLGIPRWKAYMLETAPANCWLVIANDGGSSNNLRYTSNSGATWNTSTATIDGYLDYHTAVCGSGGDINCTFPGAETVNYRRLNAPAHAESDFGPIVQLAGTSPQHRSSITMEPSGRLWIFTRRGGTAAENVKYFTSTNDGSSFTSGTAWSTGTPDVRVGSMPFIGGRPALIVLHLEDAKGYQYRLWNGTSFVAPNDYSIYPGNMGYVRAFTHNQIADSVMHLVFGRGSDLVHVWKNHNGGNGSWNTATIESSNFTLDNEWYPISTVQGNNLYLFYSRKSNDNASSSMIYYRKWSQTDRTWSAASLVSTNANNVYNRDPNTCFRVPASADYIPVFWTCGSTNSNVYFAKVVVSTQADVIAPGKVNDLGSGIIGISPVVDPSESGEDRTLNW